MKKILVGALAFISAFSAFSAVGCSRGGEAVDKTKGTIALALTELGGGIVCKARRKASLVFFH